LTQKEAHRGVEEFAEQVIKLSPSEVLAFCGQNDQRIRDLEAHVKARIVLRGNDIRILGAPTHVDEAFSLISDLLETQRRSGSAVTREQFRSALRTFRRRETGEASDGPRGNGSPGEERVEKFSELFLDSIPVPLKRRRLSPLTPGQKRYVEAIRTCDIVFGIGPAGTGKTYLAMAMAVSSLMAGAVSRIILVRPAVEAGERLGFLPGDIAQKFDPYVRPLYDALYEMMEAEQIKHALETGVIEIAPLAFMRGRTLNSSFVILDEAQNTTVEQMKMFLTRLGFESKAVVTGDITQIDLPPNTRSGLVHVQKVLRDIAGIGFTLLTEEDVVRHELVQKIIRAYERAALEETRRNTPAVAQRPPLDPS
jgi:phosphate starvation-inducible PhoH-like protein